MPVTAGQVRVSARARSASATAPSVSPRMYKRRTKPMAGDRIVCRRAQRLPCKSSLAAFWISTGARVWKQAIARSCATASPQ